MDDAGIWTDEEISLLEACVRIQGKIDRISCLASVGLAKPCNKVPPLPRPNSTPLSYQLTPPCFLQVYSKLFLKNLLPTPPTSSTTTTVTQQITTVTPTKNPEI